MTTGLSKGPVVNQSEEVKVVISKIDEFGKPDGVFSDNEKGIINDLYKKVKTAEGKKQVKEYIINHYTGETKGELSDLLGSVETQINGPFTMDTLASNSDSKFFNTILKNKAALEAYDKILIGDKIKENKDLFPNGHETLNLVYWNKIANEIGIKSAGSFAMDKVGSVFTSIFSKVTSIGDIDLSKMGDLVEDIQKIGDVEEKSMTAKQKEKVMGIMGKLIGYIDSMTKGYTENLNKLIDLGKTNKEGLKKLLDNPVILSEVLETGKTTKNGYNIDLDNKKIVFNKSPDLVKSKTEFMKTVVDSTNKSGKTLSDLKEKANGLANIYKKMGFDSSELREFRESLKDIPVIGAFLSALLGFFLDDKILNLMDGNPWEKDFEISGKALQTFIKNDKEKTVPFVVEEKMFEDEANVKSMEGFLAMIEKADESNFDNIETNKKNKSKEEGKTDFEKGTRNPLINNGDFWKTIFSDKESADPILEEIRLKVVELKKKNLSSKDFFTEISKMKITVKPVIKSLTQEEKQLKVLQEAEAKTVKSTDKTDLSLKLEKLDIIPKKIVLDNKKELNIDFKDGKILLDNKEFVLIEGDIAEIKFDTDNVILKLKDATGVETEKKYSKKEFATILTGLAIGEKVSDFVTSKEKVNLIAKNKQALETANIEKEKTDGVLAKSELEGKIKQIQKDIKTLEGDKKPNPVIIGSIENLDLQIEPLKTQISDKEQKLQTLKDSINEDGIDTKNKEILDLKSEKNKHNFYEFYDKGIIESKIIKKQLEIKQIEKENKINNNKATKLESEIKPLKESLTKLKSEKTEKEGKLQSLKTDLKTKNDKLIGIKTKLEENTEKETTLKKEIIAQETQTIADAAAERKREEDSQTEIPKLQEKIRLKKEAEDKAKELFETNIENPKKIEELKLILIDNTEITFDTNSKQLSFGGKKFEANNLNYIQEGIINKFSFKYIYKNSKEDFTKVLTDLNTNGKTTYMGITFEEVS